MATFQIVTMTEEDEERDQRNYSLGSTKELEDLTCDYSNTRKESIHSLKVDVQDLHLDENFKDLNSDPEFDDLDSGWAWIVLIAGFCTFFLLGNVMYTVGILHSALLDRYGESVSVTSWAGALHTALFSLGGPLSTAVTDRYSCRTAIVLSGGFFVLGYFTTAFAPGIEVAIFTCGILAGIGGGLSYTASMVVIGFNFKKRRNLALGIATSGVGAGLFALAPLMQFAREYYGDIGIFIFVAGFMSHIVLFGTLCFPNKLEKYSKLQRTMETRKKESTSIIKRLSSTLKPYINVLLNKGIMCLCVAMFSFSLGIFLLYLHLPGYVVYQGFTSFQASYLLSISGIVSVGGRILTGIVADCNRIDEIMIYSGSMGIVAITIFIYPFSASHFIGQIVFFVFLGLFFGSGYVVTATVSLKFVDLKFLSAAIGLEFMFGGIGAIAGPVFAGFLMDNGGSYDQSIFVAAFFLLFAAVAGGASTCFRTRPKTIVIQIETPVILDIANGTDMQLRE